MKKNKFISAARIFLIVIGVFASVGICRAQTGAATNSASKNPVSNQSVSAIKSSPAYAELLLQKTELEAQSEDFADYTEDFPKLKEIRFQADLLQKTMDKFLALSASDAPKLSLALGKLAVRKTELETSLWMLQKQYKDDYPEVKRLKRKVEVFERAIREILPGF